MLLISSLAYLLGFTPITVSPEARIKMSAWSDRILLVEITKISFTNEKIADGIGQREITVEGKVIEVIRGEQKTKTIHASKNLIRVANPKVITEHRGADLLEVLRAKEYDNTGIRDCKEGKRYLVNFTGSDCRFSNEFFFSEIPKEKDDWRKEILPRKHLENENEVKK